MASKPVSSVWAPQSFFNTLLYLFNHSLATSTIPQQWKQASIKPIPKSLPYKHHADLRPISITPISITPISITPISITPISITSVLTRIMEKTVVREFLYLTLLSAPSTLSYSNQFAFRPTGSPCAAIMSLLNTVTNMLLPNPSVTVISSDFSKALDTVRHSTLLVKMAQLDLPVNVYNWLVDFFGVNSRCTVYRAGTSTLKSITASIIQGSGIGPASYVINASDLDLSGNELCKFADDT